MIPPSGPWPVASFLNRKARRAAKRGKGIGADRVCEHGNWKKTDGNGKPMCPHGCGFA